MDEGGDGVEVWDGDVVDEVVVVAPRVYRDIVQDPLERSDRLPYIEVVDFPKSSHLPAIGSVIS